MVYINDLPFSLNSVVSLFADETALCINKTSSEYLEILVDQALKNINLWMISNGLTFQKLILHKLKLLSCFEWPNPSKLIWMVSNGLTLQKLIFQKLKLLSIALFTDKSSLFLFLIFVITS